MTKIESNLQPYFVTSELCYIVFKLFPITVKIKSIIIIIITRWWEPAVRMLWATCQYQWGWWGLSTWTTIAHMSPWPPPRYCCFCFCLVIVPVTFVTSCMLPFTVKLEPTTTNNNNNDSLLFQSNLYSIYIKYNKQCFLQKSKMYLFIGRF